MEKHDGTDVLLHCVHTLAISLKVLKYGSGVFNFCPPNVPHIDPV
jgi:hypothetical protein